MYVYISNELYLKKKSHDLCFRTDFFFFYFCNTIHSIKWFVSSYSGGTAKNVAENIEGEIDRNVNDSYRVMGES